MAQRALVLSKDHLHDMQVQLMTIAAPAQLPPPLLLPSAALLQARHGRADATVPHVAIAGGYHDWQVPESAALARMWRPPALPQASEVTQPLCETLLGSTQHEMLQGCCVRARKSAMQSVLHCAVQLLCCGTCSAGSHGQHGR